MKYKKKGCTLTAIFIAIGSLVAGTYGSVLIDITESGGNVEFYINGSIAPTALTLEELWNTAEDQTEWENHNPNQNDALVIRGESNYRYSITGVEDTGVLNTSYVNVGGGIVTNGTAIAIGTSFFGGNTSLVLGNSLASEGYTYNYTASFVDNNFSDFGLSDGQIRTVTFDDGTGGQESIQWRIGSAIPESSTIGLTAVAGLLLWAKLKLL